MPRKVEPGWDSRYHAPLWFSKLKENVRFFLIKNVIYAHVNKKCLDLEFSYVRKALTGDRVTSSPKGIALWLTMQCYVSLKPQSLHSEPRAAGGLCPVDHFQWYIIPHSFLKSLVHCSHLLSAAWSRD